MQKFMNQIITGNCADILPQIPPETYDLIITSPPFYIKRNYQTENLQYSGVGNCDHDWQEMKATHDIRFRPGHNAIVGDHKNPEAHPPADDKSYYCEKCGGWIGALGLEPDPVMYVNHLADIFDLCNPILKESGSLWINIADSYCNGKQKGYKAKSLLEIPFLFSIEMTKRGWLHRNTIIWQKLNPMPESMNDRFSNNYEYLFFFTKSNKPQFYIDPERKRITREKPESKESFAMDCYFVKQMVRQKEISVKRAKCQNNLDKRKDKGIAEFAISSKKQAQHYEKLNEIMSNGTHPVTNDKTIWDLSDILYSTTLYESFLEAGASPIVVDKAIKLLESRLDNDVGAIWDISTGGYAGKHFASFPIALLDRIIKSSCPMWICDKCGLPEIKFYENMKPKIAICGCESKNRKPGAILDIFGGVATTGLAAVKYNRLYTVIELNSDYAEEGKQRLDLFKKQATPEMFE